jgi:hypothetical protein
LGIIIIIATFFPWATISFLGESITITGIQGDGIISLIAAVIYIFMLFLAEKELFWKITGMVFSIIIAMIGLYDFIQLKKGPPESLGELKSTVEVEIGIWLVMICGVLGIIVILLIKIPKTLESSETLG